jgi:hypothetical protein
MGLAVQTAPAAGTLLERDDALASLSAAYDEMCRKVADTVIVRPDPVAA